MPVPVTASAGAAKPLPRLEVLLVEDDPGDAYLVMRELANCRRPQFHVVHAASLAAARLHLAAAVVDVILLDLSLPDSAGMGTVAQVQAVAPDTAIVVLTGLDDPAVADAVLEAGAQDYLTKDMDMSRQLSRSIRYALSRMMAQVERRDLVRRLESEQARLNQELDGARQMQMALLPNADMTAQTLVRHGLMVEGVVEPSEAVGGDVWGCFQMGENAIGIYTFDFSGHGITAALNSFRLHALIDDHAELRQDPAGLLQKLSMALGQLLRRGQFATMFYGVIDFAAETLTWSGAGHPPPILLGDGETRFLNANGLPLGVGDGTGYFNRTARFCRGTSLFLYSDAMSEAEEPEGVFFGEDNVLTLAHVAVAGGGRCLDRLLAAFKARVELPLADDLTAVLVRYPRLGGGSGCGP